MSSRRNFLFTLGLAGISADPVLSEASAVAPASPAAVAPRLNFDVARFNAMLKQPARHRQCFGATSDTDGEVLDLMGHSIDAYSVALGEGPKSMHAAAVLYHGTAVMIGYGNRAWNDLIIPFMLKPPAPLSSRVRPGEGNPYYSDIAQLVDKGASFFICHNALWSNVQVIARGLKKSPESVYKAIVGDLVPNALLVPSGVMAINACQEAKFTYIQVSV